MDTGYPALIADLPDKRNETDLSITPNANSKEPAPTSNRTFPIDTPPTIQQVP